LGDCLLPRGAARHTATLGTAAADNVRVTIARVQEGQAAQADIAAVAGVPYVAVLLHRDAG
jgi:hypothetical protein